MITVLKSPILHFILLGIVLYVAYKQLIPKQKEIIEITPQVVEALIKAEQQIMSVALSEERKQELVENYIDEEVLLREAFKRDLHKTDYRVRKQLLNLMRSSLTEVVPEPSIAQLRAHFDQNKQRYMNRESFSYEMVYFAFNSKQTPANSKEFIKKLQASKEPLAYSEFTLMGNSFKKENYQRIAMVHGRIFADSLVKGVINLWNYRRNHYQALITFTIADNSWKIMDIELIEGERLL